MNNYIYNIAKYSRKRLKNNLGINHKSITKLGINAYNIVVKHKVNKRNLYENKKSLKKQQEELMSESEN